MAINSRNPADDSRSDANPMNGLNSATTSKILARPNSGAFGHKVSDASISSHFEPVLSASLQRKNMLITQGETSLANSIRQL
jgi:hypothetical protein